LEAIRLWGRDLSTEKGTTLKFEEREFNTEKKRKKGFIQCLSLRTLGRLSVEKRQPDRIGNPMYYPPTARWPRREEEIWMRETWETRGLD